VAYRPPFLTTLRTAVAGFYHPRRDAQVVWLGARCGRAVPVTAERRAPRLYNRREVIPNGGPESAPFNRSGVAAPRGTSRRRGASYGRFCSTPADTFGEEEALYLSRAATSPAGTRVRTLS
jgi:hypothetical protein